VKCLIINFIRTYKKTRPETKKGTIDNTYSLARFTSEKFLEF